MVETSQGFDKHVDTFVSVFISACCEEVECVVRREVIVTIEMPSHEIVDFLFRLLMQILELVHGRKFLDIETVGKDAIRFAL